jgi:hypothetical protein
MNIKFVLPFLLLTTFTSLRAQDLLKNDLNLSLQTRSYLEKNGEDFSKFEASCPSASECTKEEGFHYTEKNFKYLGDVNKAFEDFTNISPDKAWNGKIFFEVGFDPSLAETYTRKSLTGVPSVQVGQVYVLKLTITEKQIIPVAFKIIEIDHQKKTFTFSYLKNNKSNGYQKIFFTQKGEYIHIKHVTYFKSDSNFRDAVLYKPFHNMLLNEFYNGLEKEIF